MDDYIVAGLPPIFRIQPNDGRTVRFPAIFALRVGVVRSLRGDAQVSQLRRTHESAVVRASSPTPERLPLLMVSVRPNPSSISRLDEPAWSALTQRREIDSSPSSFPAR